MRDWYFIDVESLWRQHFMFCGLSQLLIYTYLFCFVHVMLTWFDEISCLLQCWFQYIDIFYVSLLNLNWKIWCKVVWTHNLENGVISIRKILNFTVLTNEMHGDKTRKHKRTKQNNTKTKTTKYYLIFINGNNILSP